MKIPRAHTDTRKRSVLPEAVLAEMIEDQKRALRAWGVSIPDDGELFGASTPLSQRVRLFDYMIREAIESEFV